MTTTHGRRTLTASLTFLLLALATLRSAAQIYADFTTSMGAFTCQLDYTNAPRTVANFIGLATGQRAWLDLPTGRVCTNAFYNGVTFHRVIAGFMNQTGSPNGQGTDGPGYAFTDEFSPKLVFTNSGVMAMANSGPNSDGSQFFITVAPFTSGNNVYSIFGQLTSGSDVVNAINHVPTDANDKPLAAVVIQQVAIRRVGTAAQAFDINAQGLPVVTNLLLRITNRTGQVSLSFTNRQFADNRLYTSTNLNTWTGELLDIESATPATNTLYRAKDTPRKFFRMAQIQYPSPTFAPKTVYGRTLTLNFTGGVDVITITFNSSGGGTYTYPPDPVGTVDGYAWSQEPYRGLLWPIFFSAVYPMTLRLDFTGNTVGNFSGTAYPYYPYPFGSFGVGGTFTLTGP